jgi:hypothetical protein
MREEVERRPRCAGHPVAPAVAVCTRCGSFACLECVRSRVATVYCAACVARLWPARKAPAPVARRVWWALALSGLGVLWPVFGVMGLVLGFLEFERLKVKGGPPWEEKLVKVGLALAGVGLLASLSQDVPLLLLRELERLSWFPRGGRWVR